MFVEVRSEVVCRFICENGNSDFIIKWKQATFCHQWQTRLAGIGFGDSGLENFRGGAGRAAM